MESMVPKQMTTPIGIQRASPLMIIGSTPRAVVHEVRNIGLILRFPASSAAVFTSMPFWNLSSSAYSNRIIPFLTMIPTRLIRPSTDVRPKSRRKIHIPKKAPKKQSVLMMSVRNARDAFLK